MCTRFRSPPDKSVTGQLAWVAIASGAHLHGLCILRHHRRNHRVLERTGRGHDVICLDHPFRGFLAEARAALVSLHLLDLDPAPDGDADHLGIGHEVIRHLLLGDEGLRTGTGEFRAGKAVMPSRAVGDERIPSLRAPALRDPVSLQDDMRHAAFAQVFAHRETGLTVAYNQRVRFPGFHVYVPF